MEDDEDPRSRIPAVLIPNPRNISEYAQNVRNYYRKKILPLVDGLEEANAEIAPLGKVHLERVKAQLKIEELEMSRENISKHIPGMRRQLDERIAAAKAARPAALSIQEQARFLELSIEIYDLTEKLAEETDRFMKMVQQDTEEPMSIRSCLDCGTNANLTHQDKNNALHVYCESCASSKLLE